MRTLSVGTIRGMREITTPEGLMVILALDQRGTLLRMLGVTESDPAAYEVVSDFKLTVLEHLIPHASAALLDPQYAAAEATARGVLPGAKGLIVSLEKSGYTGDPTARLTELLPDWSVAKIKRMGGSAVKLLIDYNPDAGPFAEQQEQLVARIAEEAATEDIPLLVEPVAYSLDPSLPKQSPEFAAQRPRLVVETAKRIGALKPNVLKLEFPVDAQFNDDEHAWADACAAVDEAAPVPWAILSGGVSYDVFKRQVRIACQAGASGYVAGRTFWTEATGMRGKERGQFLATTAVARIREAAEIAGAYARPWTAHYPGLAEPVHKGWYQSYGS